MEKLTQTKINKRDEFGNIIQRGNCYATCVAMILGKKIEDIPKFEELPADGSWFIDSWTYLNGLGYDLDILHVRNLSEYPNGFSIASGKSPRGPWDHCVVYLDGKLYHDPYPNGKGIDKVDYFLLIEKK